MREVKYIPLHIDILCIGEVRSGKSSFLRNFSKDIDNLQPNGIYTIYLKKTDHHLVYFHELSQQQTLFLERSYDGIIFFIDFLHNWNPVENILRWMELQSKYSGVNIYKIPIKILITNFHLNEEKSRWKCNLEQQLRSIVNQTQILYVQRNKQEEIEKKLEIYFDRILQGKAEGISESNQNHIRLFGLNVILKLFNINVRLTFWRSFYYLYNYSKNKSTILQHFKKNK